MTANTAFSLVDYRFTEFNYQRPNQENLALNLKFTPTGTYNASTGVFSLFLGFSCNIEQYSTDFINAKIAAEFKFQEPVPFAEIPPFFYVNSIAIVFPYVRAFISTLTLQANSGLVILPTLNLIGLEKGLKEGTKEIFNS